MDLFNIVILFSAGLTISNANPYTLDSPYPPPNFPMNYFDPNVYADPRVNQFPFQNYNNFESQKVPQMAAGENNFGVYQMANQFPGSWPSSAVNGPYDSIYRLPQMQTLQDPLVFHNRGFPISPVYYDMVKGERHEIPTEAPINVEDIRFGPSASHVYTAPIRIKDVQPHITFLKSSGNSGLEHEHPYNTVERIDPKAVSEVTSQEKQVNENELDKSTKEHISTSTLPPVPTLSPWIDGFGK